MWSDEKAEAWDRAEENIRPSLGWLGEVFSRPEMLRFSPNMLLTFDIGSKKCVMRSVEPKLLPTVTVGDKKCVIRSERPILPIPSRHDSAGYLWGY